MRPLQDDRLSTNNARFNGSPFQAERIKERLGSALRSKLFPWWASAHTSFRRERPEHFQWVDVCVGKSPNARIAPQPPDRLSR
jgi:hypothetical protein